MNIQNDGILNPVPGNPNGYVSRNLECAAVPYGKKFVILHNGKQVHTANNYKTAKSYIQKALKGKSVSTLDEFI